MFGGPVAYMAMLDNPNARWTGWPAFVVMGLGTLMSLTALARDRRIWVKLLGGFNVALMGTFIYMFYFWAQIPPTPEFTSLTQAPDFTLVNHEGVEVSLKGKLAKGPVLLVFYRGFW